MTDKKGRLLRDAWHPQLVGTYIIHKDVFFKVLKFYFELFTSIRWPSSLRHRGSLLLSGFTAVVKTHPKLSVGSGSVEMRAATGHGGTSTQLDFRFRLVRLLWGSERTTMNSKWSGAYHWTMIDPSSVLCLLEIELNHWI